jgi:hypothetical protein
LSDSKRKPVNLEEWKGFFDSKGRLHVTVDEVKERVFHGGLDSEDGVRKEAWPFLLGVYEWDSTADERQALMNSKRDEYIQLKGSWWERMVENDATPEQEEWWKEQKIRIGKSIPLNSFHAHLRSQLTSLCDTQKRMFIVQIVISPSLPAKTSLTRTQPRHSIKPTHLVQTYTWSN